MRATLHNGRLRKTGEAFSPKHNDRNFDAENAPHIDSGRSRENIYFVNTLPEEAEGLSFEEHEKHVYTEVFGPALEKQNARNIATGHAERCKSIDDLLKSERTCPEETLFQVGKQGGSLEKSELEEIFREYEAWHAKHFPQCVTLDWALHVDEATPHIHWRRMWVGESKDGLVESQSKALEKMGVERPDISKPKTKWNNPKMAYTADCRDHLEEMCRERGLTLDEGRLEASKVGKELLEWQVEQDKAKIASLEAKIEDVRREAHSALSAKLTADRQAKEAAEAKEKAEKEAREAIAAKKAAEQEAQDTAEKLQEARRDLEKAQTDKETAEKDKHALEVKNEGLKSENETLKSEVNKLKDEKEVYIHNIEILKPVNKRILTMRDSIKAAEQALEPLNSLDIVVKKPLFGSQSEVKQSDLITAFEQIKKATERLTAARKSIVSTSKDILTLVGQEKAYIADATTAVYTDRYKDFEHTKSIIEQERQQLDYWVNHQKDILYDMFEKSRPQYTALVEWAKGMTVDGQSMWDKYRLDELVKRSKELGKVSYDNLYTDYLQTYGKELREITDYLGREAARVTRDMRENPQPIKHDDRSQSRGQSRDDDIIL